MDAYELILSRRSVRLYRPDPIPPETLLKIVDAGRLAPTGCNEQPWAFIVVTQREMLRRIARLADHGSFIADAGACIVVLCRLTRYYLEDGSAATTQMLLAARALGLGTCWVAGDKKPCAPAIVALCGAPATMKLVSMIAVGYAIEDSAPPKRPLADVVHWEHF